MIVLKIIGIIFLVLFLLTLIPVRLNVSFNEPDLKVKVRYGFINITLFPLKKKRKEKIKKEIENKNKAPTSKSADTGPEVTQRQADEALELNEAEQESSEPIHGEQASKTKVKSKKKKSSKEKPEKKKSKIDLQTILDLLRSSKVAARIVKNHLVVNNLYAYIVVGGDDAHETAINFSKYSIIVTNGIALLSEFVTVRLKQIVLIPDFLAPKTHHEISVQIFIRPIFAIAAALHLAVAFLKLYIKQPKPKKQKKGGIKYESAKTIK